jgi:hypothetical protein
MRQGMLAIAVLIACATGSLAEDTLPTDSNYPVRLCGEFKVKNDILYLLVRQTLGSSDVEFEVTPRRPTRHTVPTDPPLKVVFKEEVEKVKLLVTQNVQGRIIGCAYSGRLSISTEKENSILAEKLVALKAP